MPRGAPRSVLLGLLGAVAASCLAACSHPVAVTTAPRAGDASCQAAARHWPATVASQSPVTTTSSSDSVRAWGSPAIIARCGLAPPGPTTDPCLTVDGVDWVLHTLTDGVRATTFDRSPALEVLVPASYPAAPLLLPAFDAAAAQLPANGQHCS